MSFSQADILAEFVEAAGATVEAQRWLDFDGCRVVGVTRRRWNTPEERERSRKRYEAKRTRRRTRSDGIRIAARFNWRLSRLPTKAVLVAMREQRKQRRTNATRN